jgi:hypothetical protein
MATIYEKTAGALIATPGRSVATFPSGLCRVDQTYVCATAHAATHRAALAVGNTIPDGNDTPSLEPLAIFPQVQEIERGDGFTEFKVSAYGQTTTQGSGTARKLSGIQLLPVVTLGGALVGTPPSSSVDVYFSLWAITGFLVLPFGETTNISQIEYDPELGNAFDFYQTAGELLSYSKQSDTNYLVTLQSGAVGLVRLTAPTMLLNSYTNFGSYAEVSVTVIRGHVITEF